MKNKIFTIVYWNGAVEFVEDLNAFAKKYGYYSFWNRISEDANIRYLGYSWDAEYRYKESAVIDGVHRHLSHSFYIMDGSNRIMNKDAIANYVLPLKDYIEYCYSRYYRYCGFGTGRGKSRRYREPAIFRIVRAVDAVVPEEGEPEFRKKHQQVFVPIWWDEAQPRHRSRSWKENTKRQKQYKNK